jgi:hypothetical protein
MCYFALFSSKDNYFDKSGVEYFIYKKTLNVLTLINVSGLIR